MTADTAAYSAAYTAAYSVVQVPGQAAFDRLPTRRFRVDAGARIVIECMGDRHG
jgi:hypothetical protein